MIIRLAAIFLLVFFSPALAEERITDFNVAIEVQQDGDILVRETISVNSEGYQIRRGIFRDLPRFFEKSGQKIPYHYDVVDVTRDGQKEPFAIEKPGNAFRVRVGDADVFLADGSHVYQLTYEVKNQVRYFDGYDEVYWNVTGSYWAFPILHARAEVLLPGGAGAIQRAGYTGSQGESQSDYQYQYTNGAHIFETTSRLGVHEGLTVAVGFEKGIVDPPTFADARAEWWALNASRIVLLSAFLLISFYFIFAWLRVGRDPVKGPVFARYEPPEGYSPAAVHHVFHRGVKGHDALIGALMGLATQGRINIDVDSNKETKISHLVGNDILPVGKIENDLVESLCSVGESFKFGDKYNATFTGVYSLFKNRLAKEYGEPYFRWNRGFLVAAIVVSGLAVLLAANLSVEWSNFHSAGVGALIIVAILASYFLPAPTPIGQQVRTEIEGFRLYLKTAEALQLNAVDVASDAPPPMTVERYERFLPFAVALGVEKPWTTHFEKLMPREAAEYQPHWGSYGGHRGNSLGALNRALVSGISSGVTSALPQSSSSSGSGGGGSSGGGGGGGGGGGW